MRWPTTRAAREVLAETALDDASDVSAANASEVGTPVSVRRRFRWSRVFVVGVLPAAAMLLAVGAGFVRYQDGINREVSQAKADAVRAATDSTVAILSYRHDSAQKELEAAQGRLTGKFLDTYTKLTHDVVIPGAQQKKIDAVATVPAAAATSATTATHAVVLLFVDQTVNIGTDPPTQSASSVRVTLDKVANRWLIAEFEPV
jgi:Mce-associated membrane protein